MAGARDEVDALGKRARRQLRDHERAPRVNRDFRRPPAARQPDRRPFVGADHRRVDVPVAVDLRAAQEADRDPAVLQDELEHVRHAAHHEAARHERRVADRDRHADRRRADRARFVHQHEVRRMGGARQIARQVGEADPHEYDLPVDQLARRDARHHLVGSAGALRTRNSPRHSIGLSP